MEIVVVDSEVFQFDWIVVLYNTARDAWTVFHNDNRGLRTYMETPGRIYCGFNNKHYDNHILKAICCGASPQLVKNINDFIVKDERSGWDHWFLRQTRFQFDNFDLMDDTQVGTSLKSIEAHMGWDIEETEVDFDIDRPLTPEEVQKTVHYCTADVRATARLLILRKHYLDGKMNVGRMQGIPDAKALYKTNAALTAAYLGAKAVKRTDEREYHYPPEVNQSLIPKEVLDFFDRIHDMSIPDEEIFKSKLTLSIDGADAVLGFGGIHHARLNYMERSTADRVIRNFDVASLYPSLMVFYHYISRNIPDANFFETVYHNRLAAKAAGDKQTSNTLKLVLNTTYGASLASTNPLYDPLMGRSICITGQLLILELAIRYLKACKTVRIIQLNTDGIAISIDRREIDIVYSINDSWMTEKHLSLEEDKIQAIYQKDVNNYVAVYENGKVKTKGAYVTWGIPGAGAFSINNNHIVVKRAVVDYLTRGVPVRDTIYASQDPLDFQIIAKAGGGYRSVYRVPNDFEKRKKIWQRENRYRATNRRGAPVWRNHTFHWENYDGPRAQVQRVNRVYAAKKSGCGTLIKVKADGTVGKIGNLPESCLIDNANTVTIDQIDKEWYVDLAQHYLNDYGCVCV